MSHYLCVCVCVWIKPYDCVINLVRFLISIYIYLFEICLLFFFIKWLYIFFLRQVSSERYSFQTHRNQPQPIITKSDFDVLLFGKWVILNFTILWANPCIPHGYTFYVTHSNDETQNSIWFYDYPVTSHRLSRKCNESYLIYTCIYWPVLVCTHENRLDSICWRLFAVAIFIRQSLLLPLIVTFMRCISYLVSFSSVRQWQTKYVSHSNTY